MTDTIAHTENNAGRDYLKRALEARLYRHYGGGEACCSPEEALSEALPFKEEVNTNTSQRREERLGSLRENHGVDGSDTVCVYEAPSIEAHWRASLKECASRCLPSGRVFFRADMTKIEGDAAESSLRVIKVAHNEGFKCVGLIPYGFLLGGGAYPSPFSSGASQGVWARLWSYVPRDLALLELMLFLEEELFRPIANLPAPYRLWVFEKGEGALAPLENPTEAFGLNTAPTLSSVEAFQLSKIVETGVMSTTVLQEKLSGFLAQSMRCQRFLDIWVSPDVVLGKIRWEDCVSPPWAAYFNDLMLRRHDDALATQAARDILATSFVRETLSSDGVLLSEGLEYYSLECILTKVMGRFTGVRS